VLEGKGAEIAEPEEVSKTGNHVATIFTQLPRNVDDHMAKLISRLA
jgi:hypothetical protein